MSNNIKQMVITALLVAAGITLPFAFHSIPNAGSIFLPMHIPILICGIVCGWKYGLICGVLTPLLSSLLTGMPPMAYLPIMLFELGVYGFATGIIFHLMKGKNLLLKIYIALIGAMIFGRITYGILNAVYFRVGSYAFDLWISSAFITSLPGILVQITIIPIIVFALYKANLIDLKNAS